MAPYTLPAYELRRVLAEARVRSLSLSCRLMSIDHVRCDESMFELDGVGEMSVFKYFTENLKIPLTRPDLPCMCARRDGTNRGQPGGATAVAEAFWDLYFSKQTMPPILVDAADAEAGAAVDNVEVAG